MKKNFRMKKLFILSISALLAVTMITGCASKPKATTESKKRVIYLSENGKHYLHNSRLKFEIINIDEGYYINDCNEIYFKLNIDYYLKMCMIKFEFSYY